MGKWSKEFRSQLFGTRKTKQDSATRYMRRSSRRTERQQNRQMKRAKNLYNRYK